MMNKVLVFLAILVLIQGYQLTREVKETVNDQQIVIQDIQNQEKIIKDIANEYDQETGKMLAAFTQAAYCLPKKITKWKCGKPCKKYQGMQEITVIQSANKVNKGFIGYYEPLDAIVISWKGTLKIRQWMEDLNYFKTDYPYCDGCKVHRGFWMGWQGLQNYFWVAFKKLREAHPESRIYLTGHSLGAALSVFNAMDLIQHGYTDFVWYNFGQPRIGNQAVVDYISENLSNQLMRVTHGRDPVPHLPPKDFGFSHPSQEIFYDKGSSPEKSHTLCSKTNGEDPECSNKYVFTTSVVDHVFYEGWDYVYNIGLCII